MVTKARVSVIGQSALSKSRKLKFLWRQMWLHAALIFLMFPTFTTFNLPEVAEAYVHRIGRTARAGKEGEAIAFCAPEELHLLKQIERLMAISIPVASGDEPEGNIPKGRNTRSRNTQGRGKA